MQTKDKFMRVAPEDVGIRSAGVEGFIQGIEEAGIELHSFMLLRHGRVAAQGWWAPYAPEYPHTMYSLSKPFTAIAAGLAIAEEHFRLDDPVLDHFAAEAPKKPSANLAAMRVRDLLCMGTGHAAEPRPQSGKGWEKTFLAADVEHRPGTHFLYNSMATYMVASLVERTTGLGLVDYLMPRLFAPLGIERPLWDTNGDGVACGGWGLHLKTEDIARLGQLLLQEGQWQGAQLVPRHWVRLMSSYQIDNSPGRSGDWAQGYGFQLWRCRHDAYRGDGMYGQFCVVMPEQDAVLAITSGTNRLQEVVDIAFEHLLPAMENALPPDPVAAKALRERAEGLRLPAPPQSGDTIHGDLLGARWAITLRDGNRPLCLKIVKKGGHYAAEYRDATRSIGGGVFRTRRRFASSCEVAATKEGGVIAYIRLVETPFRLEAELRPDGKGGALCRTRLSPDGEPLEKQAWVEASKA